MARYNTKEGMARLTPDERRELMFMQMSPAGRNDGYVPDDCSYCDVCGDPILGSGGGMCRRCYARWETLMDKAESARGPLTNR